MIVVRDRRRLERAVKKVYRSLMKKKDRIGELHAHHMNEVTRKRMAKVLTGIDDMQIISVVIDKNRLPASVKKDTDELYRRIASLLIAEFVLKDVIRKEEPLCVVVDRKDRNNELKKAFISRIHDPLTIAGFKNLSVILQSSDCDKSLQAADFVAWSIFRKYERGDVLWYQLMAAKIVSEEQVYTALETRKPIRFNGRH